MSRDDMPPCERCGGTRGAHGFACPVPAIDRATRSLVSALKSSDEVLAEAVRGLSSRLREKLDRAMGMPDARGG